MAYTTINKPNAYFQTKLYTGGTAEAKTFDGNANLKPDWFWCKKRGAVQSHHIADSVRGITNSLRTDTTGAEFSDSETDDLASFDTNGFTFSGTGDTYNGTYQSSSYVAWCWSAGGTASSNTDGSITSNVSANTTSGFSIVSYTGTGSLATIGHGLGAVPKMMILKKTSDLSDWSVGHASLGANQVLELNKTGAVFTDASYWNNTRPTSSVLTVGTDGDQNTSGQDYIAYCFAEKKGFSKFGSYTGNGSTDGTFVYLGFRPAFVMFKNTTTGTTNWHIVDNKRDTFNIVDKLLLPNESGSEITQSTLDLTSNGFKIRVTNGFVNTSGDNYIYMAFAENPLVGTNNTPATAR